MRMTTRSRLAALLAAAALAAACRKARPAIDPEMASCIPEGALAVAGIDLVALRRAAHDARLPATAAAFLEPFRNAAHLLLASDGKGLLSISSGLTPGTAAGAGSSASSLAVSGPADLVRASGKQRQTGTTGAPDLLARAEPLARGRPIWIVARGGGTLPLTGNAANLNHLLRATEFATLSATIGDRITLDFSGICGADESALQLEENLRGLISLAAAAGARRPELAALLRGIQVRREGRAVYATLTTGPDSLDQMLRLF